MEEDATGRRHEQDGRDQELISCVGSNQYHNTRPKSLGLARSDREIWRCQRSSRPSALHLLVQSAGMLIAVT